MRSFDVDPGTGRIPKILISPQFLTTQKKTRGVTTDGLLTILVRILLTWDWYVSVRQKFWGKSGFLLENGGGERGLFCPSRHNNQRSCVCAFQCRSSLERLT